MIDIRKLANRAAMSPIGRKLGKHAPAIFTGLGIVGMIGGTVLACKATVDTIYILDEWELDKLDYEEALSNDMEPEEAEELRKEYKADGRKVTVEVAKKYIPAVVVDVASIGCLVGGSRIAHKRLLTMTGIATSTAANFASYRNRVRQAEGEEKDLLYLKGGAEHEVEEKTVTKKGKEKTVSKKVVIPNPDEHGQYSFQFKRGDAGWNSNPEYNLYYLQNMENTLNRKFRQQGYLFLNQVYDELGIRDADGKWLMTQEGQVVGWFDDGVENKRISFGIDYKAGLTPWNWDGDDHIWIEPNVDGVIIDKI